MPVSHRKLFSIVVPVFQNESNIPESVPKLISLRELLPDYALELVFVDDGSTDRSYELLTEFQCAHPETITLVRLTRNFGQTPAIQAGLNHAAGDIVGVISADLQEPYDLFPDMIRAWEDGAKFVIGERVGREENRLFAAVSGIYWWLIRRFAFPDFPHMGFDFFVIDRQVVNEVNRINEKNSTIFCLVYWLGFRAVRIPIHRRLRVRGKSQYALSRKIKVTVDTLISFTSLPSRIITYSGFFLGLMCIVYLIVTLWLWVSNHTAPLGWMTVIGLLSLIGSMFLFALGIVSEYLLRILQELKRRPPFVVDHRKHVVIESVLNNDANNADEIH